MPWSTDLTILLKKTRDYMDVKKNYLLSPIKNRFYLSSLKFYLPYLFSYPFDTLTHTHICIYAMPPPTPLQMCLPTTQPTCKYDPAYHISRPKANRPK